MAVLTAGDGQDMRLPGQDVEHAPYGDAGQRAVEAAQAEVDGVQGRRDGEGYERRQAAVLSLAGAVSWGSPAGPQNHHSAQSSDQPFS